MCLLGADDGIFDGMVARALSADVLRVSGDLHFQLAVSEEQKVDCFQCKDLEFARNLAKQMKKGYGRHNSNLSFRDQWGVSQRYVSAIRFDGNQSPIIHIRENQQARVVGTIGDGYIRQKMQDCQIGDATPVLDTDPVAPFFAFTKPRHPIWDGFNMCQPIEPVERWIFERVGFNLRQTNGWEFQYFWKRIE